MKKYILSVAMAFIALHGFGQDANSSINQTDSLLSKISSDIAFIKDIAVAHLWNSEYYKLYPTENIYQFLQLNTSTGQIEQLQWHLDRDKEFTTTINADDLTYGSGEPGTFELYPTKNMYQFILLNKRNGKMWHVQWGTESDKRWIRRIY